VPELTTGFIKKTSVSFEQIAEIDAQLQGARHYCSFVLFPGPEGEDVSGYSELAGYETHEMR
jgi:hypothetical protein